MRVYYYIKHIELGPLRVTEGGGFTCSSYDGFPEGLRDVTNYDKKEFALSDLKNLRYLRSKEFSTKLKLVKVTVK